MKLHKETSHDIYGNLSRGYWLVKESDGSRHYISGTVSESRLESVCKRVLTESDYQYWIDYCHGIDVNGSPAWANTDQTDRFI